MSALVAAIGFAGISLGLSLFPHSNLLGGFGLIFGPINWLGLIALVVSLIGWATSSGVRFLRRSKTGNIAHD